MDDSFESDTHNCSSFPNGFNDTSLKDVSFDLSSVKKENTSTENIVMNGF